jgi:hypothetical protein
MRFHWQNLNDDETRPRWGGGARHGRAWLNFGRDERRRGTEINWEWCFFWREGNGGLSFRVQRGDGVGVQLSVGIPWLASIYLTLHGGIWERLANRLLPEFAADQRRSYPGQQLPVRDYSDREISLRFHDAAIWWHLWTDPDSWSSRTPRWRNGNFRPIDFLLGHTKVTVREIERRDVLIPMPERAYAATVIIEDRVWRRPRWPFAWHRHTGANVRMESDPVPHPGKGESEYYCGEDATYSSSFPIPRERFQDPISYAIGQVVASSLDSRARYGGRDWRPKEDHRPKGRGPTGTDTAAAAS